MYNTYSLVICSLLLGMLSCSAKNGKSADNDSSNEDDKSLLWEITGNGLIKPSYLFGTIHIICKDDYFWTDAMQKALDSSDKVCMEMDIDDPALQAKVAAGLVLPEGRTLKDYFKPADYEKVANYIEDSLHIPMVLFKGMKPIAILTLMSTRAIDCANTESYEMNIMQSAQKEQKEILGLETAEEQIAALDQMNADTVADYLLETINNKGSEDAEELQKMVAAYKRQDLPALYKIIIQSKEFSSDLDGLLYDRNKKWIPVMAGIMKQQPTLFAVGAGHLWGDKGVIALLRRQGYTVKSFR